MQKMGVIGAGGIARRRTIPEVFNFSKNVKVTAVMDADFEAAKEVGDLYGAAAYRTEEEIYKSGVDFVYIASPPAFHYKSAMLAARENRHVILEKPMSIDANEEKAIAEAFEKADLKLGVAYMMRYNGYNRKAAELAAGGALGRLVSGRAQLTCWYPPIRGAWRQDSAQSGGGALMDMGGHCIDLLRWIFGDIDEVFAFTGNLVHEYAPEDSGTVMLRFKNGAICTVESYFNIPDDASQNRFEIYGSGGSVIGRGTIGQEDTGLLEVTLQDADEGYAANQSRMANSGTLKIDNLPKKGLYVQEIEDFAAAVRDDRTPFCDSRSGLAVGAAMAAIYESARTKRAIKITDL